MMRRLPALDPWLGAALVLGIALRLVQPLLWPVFDCFADECTYLQIAAALPSEDGVVPPGGADRWLWAPGYPYLLFALREFVSSPFPVPEGFKPLIEPEFPWDYFDEPAPRR